MNRSHHEPSSDKLGIPLPAIVGGILFGLTPTVLLIYRVRRGGPVPRWVFVVAPFSALFPLFMAYAELKFRCDEEFRQKAYEVHQRHKENTQR